MEDQHTYLRKEEIIRSSEIGISESDFMFKSQRENWRGEKEVVQFTLVWINQNDGYAYLKKIADDDQWCLPIGAMAADIARYEHSTIGNLLAVWKDYPEKLIARFISDFDAEVGSVDFDSKGRSLHVRINIDVSLKLGELGNAIDEYIPYEMEINDMKSMIRGDIENFSVWSPKKLENADERFSSDYDRAVSSKGILTSKFRLPREILVVNPDIAKALLKRIQTDATDTKLLETLYFQADNSAQATVDEKPQKTARKRAENVWEVATLLWQGKTHAKRQIIAVYE